MTQTHQTAGTRLPRWTPPGAADTGVGTHRAVLPNAVATALCARADELGVHLSALLFAAHLKVLGAVTAERELVTGARDNDGRTAHAATLVAGAWRDLVAEASRALAEPITDAEQVTDAEPPTSAVVETVLDLRTAAEPDPSVVLSAHYDADLDLTVTYRRDALTADHAERLAGYLVTALTLLAADLDADHDERTLLSAEELDWQRTALSGPRRPLPDASFVELFEEQAALRADRPAARHNDRCWTYAELNDRANVVARDLLALGLADEDVVAVVMDRDLDWVAATLGVLKAGGVYLPVRPDYPAARVADQLDRSRCRFAVTSANGAALAEGLGAVRLPDAFAGAPAGNPGRPLAPDQAAYIYFTSGSTGTPKGATCEHAGMLNHLYCKVDDLGVAAGEGVTQTATQSFDISLWQVLVPLLVGGTVVVVDTETQLDVGPFLDLLAAGGVHVAQVVPAYLDVMLSELENAHRPLGDLRSLSVTGEALKAGLVKRWFALYPDIDLVNAYGATEVSDDTMHAVLDRVPERDLAIVNVGRSLRNVNTYVLDERLRVVPLGAPGEIAFSGVCVGRGYVNDPERTALAFTEDPYLPGTRLYRTGDYGRWLPEGTIEFLGRRDEQVKVRGYRIEIGEVENRLLQMPGVVEAAVVIVGDSDNTKHLVAFHTGSDGLQAADLRDFLAAALPDYMIPSYFHRLDALPLTENGKTAKKRLTALAERLGQDKAAYLPPATDTERRLATAWAEVLGVLVGRIGRDDDFFRLGGTSLAAVRLVVALDRLVSLRDLVATPVLRDLAAAVDAAGSGSAAAPHSVLQRLAAPEGDARATLVCFPYAGGNAVNFQLLARELAPAGVEVLGVEFPGHDISRPDEPLVDVAGIAEAVARELPAGPVLVWGHCAGAAHAVELARRLQAEGRPAERLFLGALMLDEPAVLDEEMAAVAALSNREVTARLQDGSAYVELDRYKVERSDLIARAYRHDVRTADEYLLSLQDGAQPLLRTPVEVVAASDDPTTPDPTQRYKLWEAVADTVSVHVLDDGGHYFARTRPADVAEVVTAAIAAPCPRT